MFQKKMKETWNQGRKEGGKNERTEAQAHRASRAADRTRAGVISHHIHLATIAKSLVECPRTWQFCSHCVWLTNSLTQIKHEAGTSPSPSSCTVKNSFYPDSLVFLILSLPLPQATCPLLVPGRGWASHPDPLARLQNRQKDSVMELLCGADALGASGQGLSPSQMETRLPASLLA